MNDFIEALRKCETLDDKIFLIGAGAAKCGTSWVHRYLGELSGVVVSPLKEVHFFDTKYSGLALGDMDAFALKRVGLHLDRAGDPVENLVFSDDFKASVDRIQMIYDDNAYFSHFARLCGPETKVVCDITPGYSVIGANGFAFMKEFFATQNLRLKLFFIMRDPLDRLWSQLRHLQQINPETRIAERWEEAIQSPRICARSDYEGTVSDLDMNFDEEDLLYLFYEDLFTEPLLDRLCQFIETPYQAGDIETRQNRTEVELELPDDARAALTNMLKRQYDFCRHRFGDQVPESWQA